MASLDEIMQTSGSIILGGIVAAGTALGADYLLQNQPSGISDLAQIGIGAAWAHYGLQNVLSHFDRRNRTPSPRNTLFDKVTNILTFPALTAATYFSGNSKAHKLALDAGEKVADLFPKTAAPELTNFTSDFVEAGVYAGLAGLTLYSLNRWVVPAAIKAKDRLKARLRTSGRNVASSVVNLATIAAIALGGYSAERVSNKFIPHNSTKNYCGGASEGTPEQRALLDTIAWAEGADYNILYGGGTFSDFRDHPRKKITKWGFTSSASGRYQFNIPTHDGMKKRGYFSSGFGPEEQDKAALGLIKGEGVTQKDLEDYLKNKIFKYIAKKITGRWASIPGNTYEQGTRSLPSLQKKFAECHEVQKEGLLSQVFNYFKTTSS